MSLAASSPAAGGDLLWVSHYGGPANDYDQPDSVMVSPDGSRVFVTGTSASTVTDYDYATAAYDSATGRALWGVRYQGPGHSYDTAYGLAVSADGASVFVTGASIGVSSNYDYATVAYDAKTGAERWVRRYNGAGNGFDLALSVAVSPDSSRVFVTGESTRAAASNDDWATLAYDARTGAHLWTKRFGADNGDDEAYALAVSPDGSKVFVTGLGYPGAGDLGTVAYEASSGHLLWKNRYNGIGGAIDVGYAIAVSPDGSKVFVTGSSYGGATGRDDVTIAYDAGTGSGLWAQRYDGPAEGGGDFDEAYAIVVTLDGSKVFVTGESTDRFLFYGWATVAYDASSGDPVWVRRNEGSGTGDDIAYALTLTPDGATVVVTGSTWGTFGPDIATATYSSATGDLRWARRFDGPDDGLDEAYSAATSPDGTKVFVTGKSQGSSTFYDYATLAYSA